MSGRGYPGVAANLIIDKPTRDAITTIDLTLRDLIKATMADSGSGPAGGAPDNLAYVTIGNTASLSAERALAAAAPLTLTDGGANASATIGASIAAPAFTLGTVNTVGAAASFIRSDAGIALFDATNPARLAASAATGSAAFAPRRDHVHPFPETLQDVGALHTLTLTDVAGNAQFTHSDATQVRFSAPGGWQFNTGSGAGSLSVMNVLIDASNGNHMGLTSQVNNLGTPTQSPFGAWRGDILMNTGTAWVTNNIKVAPFVTNSYSLTHSAAATATGLEAFGAILKGPTIGTIAGSTATWNKIGGLQVQNTQKASGGVQPASAPSGYGAEVWYPRMGDTTRYGVHLVAGTGLQGTAPGTFYGFKADAIETGTVRIGCQTADRAHFESTAAQAATVLELVQKATGATAGAHANLDDKAGDPPSPNAGDIWRNGDALNFRKSGSTVDLTASGDNVSVNGTAAADADFDDATPAAAAFGTNVKWQKDASTPNNISAYLNLIDPSLAQLAMAWAA